MNHRGEIAAIVTGLAEYYSLELSPNQLAMYVADLSDLEPGQLLEAAVRYRNDPKNERFPLPAKLKAMLVLPNTDEDQARDAASRIIAAISKFGPYQDRLAMEFIGSVGWLVVQRQGGWLAVIESLTYQNQGQLQAQWRDLALSLMRRSRMGLVDQAPQLPDPSPSKIGLTHLGSLLRVMPKEITNKTNEKGEPHGKESENKN